MDISFNLVRPYSEMTDKTTMKKNQVLAMAFLCTFSSYGMDIYLSPNKKTYIHYDEASDEYVWESYGKKFTYPRRHYERMFKKHIFDLPKDKMDRLRKLVEAHSLHKKLSRPTPEDHLERALDLKDDAELIAKQEVDPCFQSGQKYKTKNYGIKLKIDEKEKKKVDHQLIKAEMHRNGFMPFGKIKNMSVSVNTQNDNLFHGAARGMGLTNYDEGIEGDDRGYTIGLEGEVAVEFEKGSIALRKYTKGYSRLKPQAREFNIAGKKYESYYHFDEEGGAYQEFLSIDGVEIEVKHEVGYKDIYFKVVGRKETLDDKDGLAAKIQDSWHDTFDGYKYHNVDHMEKQERVSGSIGLGQKLFLYEEENAVIKADYSVDRQFSTGGDSDQYWGANGSVSFQWKEAGKGGQEYASWDATLHAGVKRYDDKVTDTSYGVNITKGFQVTENNFFYLTYGVSKQDDRYNRAYSEESQNKGEGIELTHDFNAKWEYRFGN